MTRTKLDTPAFADQSVDSRNIADGTIQAQDISGSITGTQLAGSIANDKLANSSFSINGTSVSLGASSSIGVLVSWQAVTVADGSTTLTAEAGKGYFLDTNTGVIEVFLPSSPSRGDVIILADYSGTFATNKCIINTGGQLIDSTSGPDFKVETNNAIVELVYVDTNKGWLVNLNQAAGTTPDAILTGNYDNPFIQATGGTVTTSGDFKIHTFTGDGNFIVSSAGASPAPSAVDYMVVAGGGGGGSGSNSRNGGGGAGGYRASGFGPSPLQGTAVTITATTFPISVGGGGAAANDGSNSIFSTITSAGGGGGGPATIGGRAGGSGGGGGSGHAEPIPNPSNYGTGAAGNTPPVSPPQGNAGGNASGSDPQGGGGGGGATAVGGPTYPSGGPGLGGAGSPNSINGSDTTYAGGGGGAHPGSVRAGGSGGGGAGGNPSTAGVAGTANTGGGGGAGGSPNTGGAGGKGIVILRYKFQ
tara:strand:+ start:650 stop:2071 length:1422 start_codon:yes stop_codon:yes gene_type:complete